MAALEAAGIGLSQEAELARASMAEFLPLLGKNEQQALNLVGDTDGDAAKVNESAEPTPKTRKGSKKAETEPSLTDNQALPPAEGGDQTKTE